MSKIAFLCGGLFVGALAGAFAGYRYALSEIDKVFDETVNDAVAKEVAAAKQYYDVLYKRGEYSTPVSASEKLAADAQRTYSGVSKEGEVLVERSGYRGDLEPPRNVGELITRNIFEEREAHEARKVEQDVNFDYADEIRARTEEAPYIISQDEYLTNEEEFSQVVVSYYTDGVLADENDDVIEDIDYAIGNDNIVRFGHRSGDNNIVYVRNHVLEIDYEVHRAEMTYVEMIGR